MPEHNRVAVITGAAMGIGRQTAIKLAENGVAIAIWDLNLAGAEETVKLVQAVGGRACACEVDIVDAEQVAAAAAATRDRLGPITILINNASYFGSAPFEELSWEEWTKMIDVDLHGPFHCTKTVIDDMLEIGWGRIINITSNAAHAGTPFMAHYVAAKNGLIGLTKALAMEYAARGITVNTVAPGYIDGPRLRINKANFVNAQASIEKAAQQFPMKRAGTAEEVAAAIAFIASEDAGYITGQALNVNGGRYLL
ncbi:MAG: SDR family NAD(P)-dependent oxidoreductase [Novosphingobium sp.]